MSAVTTESGSPYATEPFSSDTKHTDTDDQLSFSSQQPQQHTSDIPSSDLHLKVFTVKYQTEVESGEPHAAAKANALQFCSANFDNDSFLTQWLAENDSRLKEKAQCKENSTDPNGPVGLSIRADRVVSCLALGNMLDKWAQVGDRLTPKQRLSLPLFEDATLQSNFTTVEYCTRLGKYLHCSTSTVVIAAAILKRLSRKFGTPFVTSLTHHRLLLASLYVAAKLCDDYSGSCNTFSRVGCVAAHNIVKMESFILQTLDFALFISPEEYEKNRRMLEGIMKINQSELQGVQSGLFKSAIGRISRWLQVA